MIYTVRLDQQEVANCLARTREQWGATDKRKEAYIARAIQRKGARVMFERLAARRGIESILRWLLGPILVEGSVDRITVLRVPILIVPSLDLEPAVLRRCKCKAIACVKVERWAAGRGQERIEVKLVAWARPEDYQGIVPAKRSQSQVKLLVLPEARDVDELIYRLATRPRLTPPSSASGLRS